MKQKPFVLTKANVILGTWYKTSSTYETIRFKALKINHSNSIEVKYSPHDDWSLWYLNDAMFPVIIDYHRTFIDKLKEWLTT